MYSTKLLLATRVNKAAGVQVSSFNAHTGDGTAICNHFIDFVKEVTGLFIKKTQINTKTYSSFYNIIALNEDGEEVSVASIFDDSREKQEPDNTAYEHDGIFKTEHITTILLNLITSGHIPFSGYGADLDKDTTIPGIALFSNNGYSHRVNSTCSNDSLLSKLTEAKDSKLMRVGLENYNNFVREHERFYSNLEENENNPLKKIPVVHNKYETNLFELTGRYNEDGDLQVKPFEDIDETDIKNTLLLEPEVIGGLCEMLSLNFTFSKLSTSIALDHDIVYYGRKLASLGDTPEFIEPNEHYGTVVDSNVLNGKGSLSQAYEYADTEVREYIIDSISCLLFYNNNYEEGVFLGGTGHLKADDAFLDDKFGYQVNIHKAIGDVVSVKSYSRADLGNFLFLLWDAVDPDDEAVEDICLAFYCDTSNHLYSVAKIDVKTKGLVGIDIFDSKERALKYTVVAYSKKTGLTASQSKQIVDNAAKYYKSGHIVRSTTAIEFFDIK